VADKNVNIDLLFRNGLKDLEVLPPIEAWDKIYPVVRRRQRPLIYLRSAALIAVLVSIGFMAYRWSQELTAIVQKPEIALGEESVKYQNNSITRLPSSTYVHEVPSKSAPENIAAIDKNDSTAGVEEDNFRQDAPNLVSDYNPLTAEENMLLPLNVLPIAPLRKEAGFDNEDNMEILTNDIPKSKINRWSIMAMASPTYYSSPVSGGDEISREINSFEQSQISYTGGVGFAYKINNKLSIQSGLYYSSIGQEVGGINSFGGFRPYDYTKGDHNFEVLTSNGLIYTDNADVFLLDRAGDRVLTRYTNDIFDPAKANLSYINNSLYQNFSYLEMPLILRYKFIDKTIDFDVIGGLSYNLLINNSVHTMMDGTRYSVGKTAGLNQFMVSSSLGMGMEYNLSEKFSLNLEPTFRYYLNPFGLNSGIKTHPYSFGIFSGLSFKF
jgi:opacity protein-like surface antigen